MTIEYAGREMPCFFARANPPCANRASHRAEGKYVVMHVCDSCVERARGISPPTVVIPLASEGYDTIDAVPLDPQGLLHDAPHVRRITDHDGRVVERSSCDEARRR